jgi:large subunit ribosomal protein L23
MNPYIIKKPIVTEKSLALANSVNIYTFEVDVDASKHQVKEAVEGLFAVSVTRIRTIIDKPVSKRTGRRRRMLTPQGKVKRALVTLKEGNSIALFEVGGEESK